MLTSLKKIFLVAVLTVIDGDICGDGFVKSRPLTSLMVSSPTAAP